jgi:hypothetical protein
MPACGGNNLSSLSNSYQKPIFADEFLSFSTKNVICGDIDPFSFTCRTPLPLSRGGASGEAAHMLE